MSQENASYEEYQSRFQRLVGEIQPGQYGQFRGRLVRRLNAEQFEEQTSQYSKLGNQLMNAINSGETLNEQLMVEIRAAEVSLVLERSNYLP